MVVGHALSETGEPSGLFTRVGGDQWEADFVVDPGEGAFFSELTRASRDQVTGRSVLREPVLGRRTAANGTGVSFLPVLGHQDETRAAYDGVVDLYASMFANGLETHPFARNMIGTFAELVRGTGNLRVADVGCGPGHVTAMLHDLGLDAFGLDLSPAMVAHARRAHPALRFDEARMEALPVEDGALGGVLSHYSMIHTPPGELPALLAEQVRALAPGGLLLVSFFGTEGPEPVRFDHKVAPAYSWPAEQFAELLAGAGLVTFARLLHDPASERGFLDTHLLARRP
jgi:SAM-dependent methyltransferase